jgi:SAM-dependent methyltransferase
MVSLMRAEFDEFAGNYDAALNQGLKFTGESRTFFAEGRMRWLSRRLAQLSFQPRTALDFGCGTGGSLPFFFKHLGVSRVTATDLSADSLGEARREHPGLAVEFQPLTEFKPPGDLDLAFCNGVFHHIPLAERAKAATQIYDSLRPGGRLAFWENNPWNPVTRFMMNRVPFDRDAILVWPRTARDLLRRAGFEVARTDFMFIFPSVLSFLRKVEPWLVSLPLGGQYLVLAKKPASASAARSSQAAQAATR